MWVTGSGRLSVWDEWKHYRDCHEKKTTSIFPDVILISLSQCHLVRAKLLIEFDGASAALWNDIRHHGLLPRGLRLYPCPVLFAPSSLCISITLSGHVNVLWWITEQTHSSRTNRSDPGPSNHCVSFTTAYGENGMRNIHWQSYWWYSPWLTVTVNSWLFIYIYWIYIYIQCVYSCLLLVLYTHKYTNRVWNHSVIQY